MSDRYQQLANAPVAKTVIGRLGLPTPPPLARYEPGQPVASGPVRLGSAAGGRLAAAVGDVLHSFDVEVRTEADDVEDRFAGLVFDASGIVDSSQLRRLWEFFHPVIRRLTRSGRLLVLGTHPELCDSPRERTAQRALEGFVRSAAKEIGRNGSTGQLVYVAPGADTAIESTLRFLLSARSAYVSAQVVRVGAVDSVPAVDRDRPLDGKVAVVTGAARGIGEAIAETLARDGAHVVCLDIPAQGEALTAVANRIGGSTLQLDITDSQTPAALAEHLLDRHGGVDVMVHNAGVTRDRTIGRMSADEWDMLLDINLSSEERINDALIERDALRAGGRVVCVSSLSGIAGNRGQANYATSKAGVIGMVEALAPVLAGRAATINAVAPGFIETSMTAAMPVTVREAGRRMNSLTQGGRPVDVAETIAWFADPGSAAVNGNVVRVCGQSLLGA
jgi:3-oxoacyl-[acyl-carrier protein] reductase